MEAAILFCGVALAAVSVMALALSNRSKDRTIEKLVLMGKAKNAREYGFAKAIERVKTGRVDLPAPADGELRFRHEEPLPESELAAEFNRPA